MPRRLFADRDCVFWLLFSLLIFWLIQLYLDALVLSKPGCAYHRTDGIDIAAILANYFAHILLGNFDKHNLAIPVVILLLDLECFWMGQQLLHDGLCKFCVVAHLYSSVFASASGSAA